MSSVIISLISGEDVTLAVNTRRHVACTRIVHATHTHSGSLVLNSIFLQGDRITSIDNITMRMYTLFLGISIQPVYSIHVSNYTYRRPSGV